VQTPDVAAVNLPLLLSVLALSMCFFSFIFLMFYIKRKTRVKVLQEQIVSGIRSDVNDILKSLDETTERDITLMEEQKKNLRNMLEEIDKRLKVYIRELDLRGKAEETYKELNPGSVRNSGRSIDSGRSIHAGQSSPQREPAAGRHNSYGYQELGKNRYRINKQELSPTVESSLPDELQKPQAGIEPPVLKDPPDLKERTVLKEPPDLKDPTDQPKTAEIPIPSSAGEQIRSLVRAGFSPQLIAARLGLSIAEVELAVALLERREK